MEAVNKKDTVNVADAVDLVNLGLVDILDVVDHGCGQGLGDMGQCIVVT